VSRNRECRVDPKLDKNGFFGFFRVFFGFLVCKFGQKPFILGVFQNQLEITFFCNPRFLKTGKSAFLSIYAFFDQIYQFMLFLSIYAVFRPLIANEGEVFVKIQYI